MDDVLSRATVSARSAVARRRCVFGMRALRAAARQKALADTAMRARRASALRVGMRVLSALAGKRFGVRVARAQAASRAGAALRALTLWRARTRYSTRANLRTAHTNAACKSGLRCWRAAALALATTRRGARTLCAQGRAVGIARTLLRAAAALRRPAAAAASWRQAQHAASERARVAVMCTWRGRARFGSRACSLGAAAAFHERAAKLRGGWRRALWSLSSSTGIRMALRARSVAFAALLAARALRRWHLRALASAAAAATAAYDATRARLAAAAASFRRLQVGCAAAAASAQRADSAGSALLRWRASAARSLLNARLRARACLAAAAADQRRVFAGWQVYCALCEHACALLAAASLKRALFAAARSRRLLCVWLSAARPRAAARFTAQAAAFADARLALHTWAVAAWRLGAAREAIRIASRALPLRPPALPDSEAAVWTLGQPGAAALGSGWIAQSGSRRMPVPAVAPSPMTLRTPPREQVTPDLRAPDALSPPWQSDRHAFAGVLAGAFASPPSPAPPAHTAALGSKHAPQHWPQPGALGLRDANSAFSSALAVRLGRVTWQVGSQPTPLPCRI
ncbi:hypothetical protein T492DRAFT_1016498 [Pavlovales sp. CCMP2436]|nr:hypothetical protein T492DRAFT_1016498 [Pavlovales sp. CCMP2436]